MVAKDGGDGFELRNPERVRLKGDRDMTAGHRQHEAAQDVSKVLAAGDQQVVKARSTDGPDPALGDGVGLGGRIGVQMIRRPIQRRPGGS